MSIIIDFIIVGIILLCIFLGYKRGLTGSILKIISFVLAIVIAAILYKPVAGYLKENTQIDDSIREAIVQTLDKQMDEKNQIQEDTSNLPNTMIEYINQSLGKLEESVRNEKSAAVQAIANNITETILYALAAVGTFIVMRILLFIASIFLKFITELPIIKQVDEVGGLLYGILEGIIIVWVIISILTFISPLIESTGVIEAVNKSFIGGILYNNNLLLKWIF